MHSTPTLMAMVTVIILRLYYDCSNSKLHT